MHLVSRRRTILAFAAAAMVGGCLSPTLPLPPPSPPNVSETDEVGTYRLTGAVQARSHVTAWNWTTGLSYGEQTGADGRYDFLVYGSEGDSMSLTYRVGTDESEPADFELEPRR